MRHKKVNKREIEPDKIYKSKLLAKFINNVMVDGKKSVAEGVVYGAFNNLSKQGKEPLATFERALQVVAPKIEVKARRVGGANYQVPVEVRGERKTSLAIRWIIEAARKRSSKDFHTFAEKLAAEFLDASNNAGEAIKKRDIVHKMADANKAFAHFRW